jgi:RNA methyltransferase, TrmH family
MLITSLQNPKVKAVVALRDRRDRERSGLMRVEGFEEVSLALASGARLRTLFVCPPLFASPDQQRVVEQIGQGGADVYETSAEVFAKMAYREGPDGWLATFDALRTHLADLRLGATPFVIVAEALEKPGNLGAILRTADAVGVDAVVAAAPVTDWGNPNIVRASKGAVFSVPVAAANTADTLQWLREHRVAIVAATPAATDHYTDVDLHGPVAIAVGAEKVGLSDEFLAAADLAVRIPMFGRVNSLNVSIATALLAYEVLRQRQAHQRVPSDGRWDHV